MNSNCFMQVRVQKKYFFEFGKMIEFKFEFVALAEVTRFRIRLQAYHSRGDIQSTWHLSRPSKNMCKNIQKVFCIMSLPYIILFADISLMNQLPNEVLLKIFRMCNTETRVFCSRVCWRWYHIAYVFHVLFLAL